MNTHKTKNRASTACALCTLALLSRSAMAGQSLLYQGQVKAIPLEHGLAIDTVELLDVEDATQILTSRDKGLLFDIPLHQISQPSEIRLVSPELQTIYFQESHSRHQTEAEQEQSEVVLPTETQHCPETRLADDSRLIQHSIPFLLSAEENVAQQSPVLFLDHDNSNSINITREHTDAPIESTTFSSVPCFYFTSGASKLTSSNTLVNSGFISEGTTIGFRSPNQRLGIEVGQIAEPTKNHGLGNCTAGADGLYRTEARTELLILKNKLINWSLDGSYLGAPRLLRIDSAKIFTNRNTKHRLWGIGTRIDAFSDRLSLDFDWAKSHLLQTSSAPYNEGSSQTHSFSEPVASSVGVTKNSNSSGSAWRYAMNLALIPTHEPEPIQSLSGANLELLVEHTSPHFSAPHSENVPGSKYRMAHLTAYKGPVSLEFKSSSIENKPSNDSYFSTTSESTTMAALQMITDAWKSYANSAQCRENTVTRSEKLRSLLGQLLPSEITINAYLHSQESEYAVDLPFSTTTTNHFSDLQTSRSLGLSSQWHRTNTSTSVESNLTLHDLKTEFDVTRQRELYTALMKDIYIGNLTLSTRLGVSNSKTSGMSWQTRGVEYDWGVSSAYTTRDGVSFSLAFDSSKNARQDFTYGDSESTQSQGYSASVEIGAWLFKRFRLSQSPLFSISWASNTSEQRSSYFSDHHNDQTIEVNIGMAFL